MKFLLLNSYGLSWILACGFCVLACTETTSELPSNDLPNAEASRNVKDTDGACSPDAELFESSVKTIISERCGQCHGPQPQSGAPFSLLEYSKLTLPGKDGRIVDKLLGALSKGTMPPAGQPHPTEEEFKALIAWASCGRADVPYQPGLVSSARPMVAPSEVPSDLKRIELTAKQEPIPSGTVDKYVSFMFENIVSEEQFVRRFDVIIDQHTIVHHVNIHYASDGDDRYLYAWAPGTGAFQFPEGGLRIRPTDHFRVEIHYNNLLPDNDLVDSSGIVMFVAEPTGTEYEMAAPNTFAISIPGHSQAEAVATCSTVKDFTVLAGMPHMHVIGSQYRHDIVRADGSVENLIKLSNWSFESQLFYELPVKVHAGDEMKITCTYINDGDNTVIGGKGTQDEMCYDFMYITPPGGLGTCQGGI